MTVEDILVMKNCPSELILADLKEISRIDSSNYVITYCDFNGTDKPKEMVVSVQATFFPIQK